MARALFEKIRDVLIPRDKARLLLVRKDDALASGCIYVYHRRVLDVLRLNMDSKFLDLSPNFLNTEASLIWARKRGVVYYNWQSAPSREDGVYRYKKQWGAQELPYYYVTRLLCPPDRIREIGLGRLKSDYPFHFVVPYKVFEKGFDRAEFKK